MPGLGTTLRRYVTGFLAIALLGALWTTALGRISERSNAISLLTSIGTEVLNPILVNNGSGLAQSTYTTLQKNAASNPNQPIQLAFVKPAILGKEIAGKSFADGSAVIYAHVAQAYYDGGPGAAFSLPANLQQIVNTYSPFIQNAQNAASQASGQLPIPQLPIQLPSFAEPLWAATGISPTTLTASGHDYENTWSLRFWLASLALGAVLALFSTGWARLSSLGWAVFHSAWHITSLLLIAGGVIYFNAAKAAAFKSVLGIVGGAFIPVYLGATITGLVIVGIATFLPKVLAARAGGAARVPVPVGAGQPAGAAGSYQPGGYQSGGYQPGGYQSGGYTPAQGGPYQPGGYSPSGGAYPPSSMPQEPHPYAQPGQGPADPNAPTRP